ALLLHGANPENEFKGSRPIHAAVELETSSLLRLLLAMGVSTEQFNSNGLLPIHKAAALGQGGMIHMLLSQNPEQKDALDQKGEKTPLCIATMEGKSSAVEELLS